MREDAGVLGGEVQQGGEGGVGGEEEQPEEQGAGDGEDVVFGPDVGDEGGFAEDGGDGGGVDGGAPDPVAGELAVALDEVGVEDERRDIVDYE